MRGFHQVLLIYCHKMLKCEKENLMTSHFSIPSTPLHTPHPDLRSYYCIINGDSLDLRRLFCLFLFIIFWPFLFCLFLCFVGCVGVAGVFGGVGFWRQPWTHTHIFLHKRGHTRHRGPSSVCKNVQAIENCIKS